MTIELHRNDRSAAMRRSQDIVRFEVQNGYRVDCCYRLGPIGGSRQ